MKRNAFSESPAFLLSEFPEKGNQKSTNARPLPGDAHGATEGTTPGSRLGAGREGLGTRGRTCGSSRGRSHRAKASCESCTSRHYLMF